MFGKLKEKAEDIKNKAGGFQDTANDKIQEYMLELNDLIPAIQEIGYNMNEVEIEIGVPPKIIPHFAKVANISEETTQIVLDKYSDKKISTLILSSLIKASNMQTLVKIGDLKFTEVELELGLIPTVKIKFLPNDEKLNLIENN